MSRNTVNQLSMHECIPWFTVLSVSRYESDTVGVIKAIAHWGWVTRPSSRTKRKNSFEMAEMGLLGYCRHCRLSQLCKMWRAEPVLLTASPCILILPLAKVQSSFSLFLTREVWEFLIWSLRTLLDRTNCQWLPHINPFHYWIYWQASKQLKLLCSQTDRKNLSWIT